MIILLDNYDSFTYNLVHAIGALLSHGGPHVRVVRNDAITAAEIIAEKPEAIVISPGPATPDDAGISVPLVLAAGEAGVPLLGVCLGHQAMGQAYGGRVVRAPMPVHGKTDLIEHTGRSLCAGLPNPFTATRYHSLMVEEATLPDCLKVLAFSTDGVIQVMQHKTRPQWGVQFHPESIATPDGGLLLKNFLHLANIDTNGSANVS